jgi:transposase
VRCSNRASSWLAQLFELLTGMLTTPRSQTVSRTMNGSGYRQRLDAARSAAKTRYKDGPMARPSRYSPEVRERFVRLVYGSQWAAIEALAPKAGCTTETLRRWVRQAERDTGHRPGLTSDERARPQGARAGSRRIEARQRDSEGVGVFAQAELDRRGK